MRRHFYGFKISGFGFIFKVNPSHDPGICNISRRGKLVLVKDRNDNDKLLVCVKGRKYYWSMLDGMLFIKSIICSVPWPLRFK